LFCAAIYFSGYTIKDLDFKNSPVSLPIPGKNISHQQYFAAKGIKLEYPNEKPMIVVEGRQKMSIFLPPELVAVRDFEHFIYLQKHCSPYHLCREMSWIQR
jgi:hypothetical protein